MNDRLKRLIDILLVVVGTCMGLFHLYTAAFGVYTAILQRGIHLGFGLTIGYLIVLRKARTLLDLVTGVVALALGLSSIIYLDVNLYSLVERYGILEPADIVFGIILILVILDFTKRTLGWALPIIAGVFLLYAFAGPVMPGLLHHRGYDVSRVIDLLYLTTHGIFGVALGVSADLIFIFVLMGAFLTCSGVGDFYISLANALFGRARGGPAKVAVFASALFGTISGSGVANVVTTGSITIPMMKRLGYRPAFAGAVEAVASTGGQIMPPVMGAAAFVMAELLNVPYSVVARAAIIPAIIYFFSVFMAVHFEAVRTGIQGLSKAEMPDLKRILRSQWYFVLPVALLICLLLIVKWTPQKVAVYTIASIVVISFFAKRRKLGFKAIIEPMVESAQTSLVVISSCASAGIIIGVISLTGLGLRFSSVMVATAGGNIALMLVLIMISCLILGMGLSTTPAYLILAVLAAPPLIKLGVPPLSAHMFIFYFGCLSLITPPVATAAYAAAGIAQADPFKVGITASRLAVSAFLAPYLFLYNPSLLLQGELLKIITVFVTAMIGAVALSGAIIGWFITSASFVERVILFASAVGLIDPGSFTDYLGLAGLLGIIAWQYWKKRRQNSLSETPQGRGGSP